MMKNICRAVLFALALCLLTTTALCEELTGMTATEIVARMGIGWNLGNSFDATGGNQRDIYSQEQSWGNPIVDEALIRRVKDAGFTTIRIPVTWYRHTSRDGAYTINPDYLARVKEVVDYARAQDLFVIINFHHEEWINDPHLDQNYLKIGEQLSAMWKQVADAFADYDQHLIFEGMNEPRMKGTSLEWNGGNDAGREAVNYLNQVFVNAVRQDAKGHNGERCLMIPGYAASSSSLVLNSIAIPVVNGEAVNNLIISVHCYSPYDFCLSDAQVDFDPGNSSHVSGINNLMADIKRIFLDKGYPVIIGETSATNTNNNTEARERWAYYMGAKSAEYGVPIIIWDNGNHRQSSGGECHGWIYRRTQADGALSPFPTVLAALMEGKNSLPWGGASAENGGKSLVGNELLWHEADGLLIEKPWDNTYLKMTSQNGWYGTGCEIAVVYTGSGTPQLVLDSAEKNQWWMEVPADRIETVGDKQVAWFTARKMMAVAVGKGVTAVGQIGNVAVIGTHNPITVHEVSLKGATAQQEKTWLTFKANGRIVASGTTLPEDPSFPNMVFAGWYTTKDYQPGTEYTGGPLTGDGIVYAKMALDIQ